ncbi:hypothetical protein FRX31_028729 [Thalictrum thalictroides]|uniref:Uncharacterized protein n=1 Tax=Thalictrum thalictroides TaxID=46969 RepID=A0A7J6V9B3_THATH|nr:hypothetical protein FRX31_028729 [Thalictrum thalictroides]
MLSSQVHQSPEFISPALFALRKRSWCSHYGNKSITIRPRIATSSVTKIKSGARISVETISDPLCIIENYKDVPAELKATVSVKECAGHGFIHDHFYTNYLKLELVSTKAGEYLQSESI